MSDDKPQSRPQQKTLRYRIGRFLMGKSQDRADLLDRLKDACAKKILDAQSLSMIQGILQFSETHVKDVMVPRVQMKVIPKDAELVSIFARIVEFGHSRFPVIEGDRSKVVGVLLAKDLLVHALSTKKQTVADLMRPVSVVPESKRINVLLQEFRAKRNHMAIVVDEYGMTAGLVTIEDVLEEIVGEIEDEHDAQETQYVEQHNHKKFTLKAIMPITEFNAYFAADLQDEEHDTIGGFVAHKLGHMPKKGEKLHDGSFRFEVLHADDRRVYLLRLRLLVD